MRVIRSEKQLFKFLCILEGDKKAKDETRIQVGGRREQGYGGGLVIFLKNMRQRHTCY